MIISGGAVIARENDLRWSRLVRRGRRGMTTVKDAAAEAFRGGMSAQDGDHRRDEIEKQRGERDGMHGGRPFVGSGHLSFLLSDRPLLSGRCPPTNSMSKSA
jgi:hypothetical protein